MSPGHGSLLADESFGNKRVRIYSQGYVQVSGLIFGAKSAPFEKLSAIEDSSDVQKKSALGRTAGAALTMGLNVALSSNKRGDVYLAIVTSTTTYMLHDDPPTERGLKAAKKLAAAGRAALAQAGQHEAHKTPSRPTVVTPPQREATPATPGPMLIVRTERGTYSLREQNRTAAGDRAVARLLEVWADVQDDPTAESAERRLCLSTVLDGKNLLLYSSGHITVKDRLVHGSAEPDAEKIVSLSVASGGNEEPEPAGQADPPRTNDDEGSPSTADRLRELNSLLTENLISEEEFAQLRARVLEDV